MPCLLRESPHKQVAVDCIESVKRFSSDYEFIIVDDGSPLMTGFLQDEADVYIRFKENRGETIAENTGISVARGEYIVVINDDIVVREGWLEGLEKPFLERSNIGAVGPAIYHEKDITRGRTGIVDDYLWFSGSCYMINRNTLAKVGKLDEYFNDCGGEDTDYFQRVLDAGLTLTRNFDVVINHREGDVLHNLGNYNKKLEEARQRYVKKFGYDLVEKFHKLP